MEPRSSRAVAVCLRTFRGAWDGRISAQQGIAKGFVAFGAFADQARIVSETSFELDAATKAVTGGNKQILSICCRYIKINV